jgi:acyl carrier protein
MSNALAIRRFALDLVEGRATSGDPLEEGLLDSLEREQLIAFLEQRFGLVFEDDDLVSENFSSLGRVAELVDAKLRGAR